MTISETSSAKENPTTKLSEHVVISATTYQISPSKRANTMTIPARLLVFIYAFVMLFKNNKEYTCIELIHTNFKNKRKAQKLIEDYLENNHNCYTIVVLFHRAFKDKWALDNKYHFKFFRMMTLIKISMS